jgi:type IX secretion system PorP/SprF family membrane protein
LKDKQIPQLISFIVIGLFFLNKLTYTQDAPTSQGYFSFLSLNPANVTFLSQPSLTLNYRNQWPGVAAPYKNYSISYNHLMSRFNSGLGLNISNDTQGNGIINELSMDAIYAYHLQMTSYSSVDFGFVTSITQRNYNVSGLSFEDDTEFINGMNKTYLNFGMGFKARVHALHAGFSVKHITNPIHISGGGTGFRKDMLINIHGGGYIPIGYNTIYQPDLFFSPAVAFLQQGMHQQLQYGANIIRNPFLVGLHFRQNLGFNFDSFSISVGFLQSSYNFVYSYDVSAPWTGIKVKNSGAHEVTFLWKFKYNEKSKKYRAIKCPEI